MCGQGEESEFDNNEDLIHRQNWIAQQGMAGSKDYLLSEEQMM